MKTSVVILGGPGVGTIVAQAIAELAQRGTPIEVAGFLNDRFPAGTAFAGGKVIGRFSDWQDCPASTVFISAIPKPKQAIARFRLILSLGIPPSRWMSVRHPGAFVARDVPIGAGTYVGPGAIVEPGAHVGSHCCLRGGSYVSHDTRLGDFCFIGPNATLLGNVRLGEGVHVGPNAVCREELTIGDYAVVSLGAVVIKDVPAHAVVVGNPARAIDNLQG